MFIKRINGSCDFSIEQKFETAEKAAEGNDAKSVEVKVSNHKIDFTTVRREDDGSQKRTPEAKRQGTEEV